MAKQCSLLKREIEYVLVHNVREGKDVVLGFVNMYSSDYRRSTAQRDVDRPKELHNCSVADVSWARVCLVSTFDNC